MFDVLVGIGAVVYLVVFVAFAARVVFRRKSSLDGDGALCWTIVAMAAGLAIVGYLLISAYLQANPSAIASLLGERETSYWLGIAATSLVFALTSYFAVQMINDNLHAFSPASASRKSVIVAITLSLLVVAVCFVGSEQINKILAQITDHAFGVAFAFAACALLGYMCWRLASKSAAPFFYETLLLTTVPGFCWFARLRGEIPALMIGTGLLLGGLLSMGQHFISRAQPTDKLAFTSGGFASDSARETEAESHSSIPESER